MFIGETAGPMLRAFWLLFCPLMLLILLLIFIIITIIIMIIIIIIFIAVAREREYNACFGWSRACYLVGARGDFVGNTRKGPEYRRLPGNLNFNALWEEPTWWKKYLANSFLLIEKNHFHPGF